MPKNQQNRVENLIEFIIDFAEKNNITAYQLGKNSSISASSVNKIFSKENKAPKLTTLLKLQEDLEKMIVGTKAQYELNEEFQSKVAAEETKYTTNFKDLKIDDKLNIIYQQNLEVNKKIELITTGLSNLILDFEESEILKQKSKA